MHGLGNDFVVIDELSTSIPITPLLAQKICDRRFGVGADQLLWLRKAHDSRLDVRMEILNADGSIAEMCGNGIRAIALYLNQHSATKKADYRIETLAGEKTVKIQGSLVSVDMGEPILGAGFQNQGEPLRLEGNEFRFFEVSLGNPHAVFFHRSGQPSVESLVKQFGRQIEVLPRFPNRTNVEFVEIIDPHSIRVRVWERGAGITLACGTGACAAAVASLATGRVEGVVEVDLPGGRLRIAWEGVGKSVIMEGPAQEVFQGTYFVESTGLKQGRN